MAIPVMLLNIDSVMNSLLIEDVQRFREGILVVFSDDSIRYYPAGLLISFPPSPEEMKMIEEAKLVDQDG
jgi:hypothetical protein